VYSVRLLERMMQRMAEMMMSVTAAVTSSAAVQALFSTEMLKYCRFSLRFVYCVSYILEMGRAETSVHVNSVADVRG
jgi:hypothetical protein